MSEQKPKIGVGIKPTPVFFEAHRIACENNEITYKDPETGLQVLTAFYLTQRGYCCTSRCRHCPYGIHELDTKKIKGE